MTPDNPTNPSPAPEWGSDVVAQFLRDTEVPFLVLNPGASFRGLHDSVVNFLGDKDPQLLMCLHEEHAVALAHGYAKVTGRPLAVALHSNVGLMHATMAIYNAWVDRVPVFLLGATGPLDAARRRPWIEWIHTSADQAALVRAFVKWDDQPLSIPATAEALARAWEIVLTPPHAPTYVVLDAAVQEWKVETPSPRYPPRKYDDIEAPDAPAKSLQRSVALLTEAERPVVLLGRVSRSTGAWKNRVELVERLGATAITDLKVGAAFPTEHPQHVGPPGFYLSPAGQDALATADVVLSLDWVDLAGTLAQAPSSAPRTIISASQDSQLHNGWSKDHQAFPTVEVMLPTTPDGAVSQLLRAGLGAGAASHSSPLPAEPQRGTVEDSSPPAADRLGISDIARVLRAVTEGLQTSLVRLPLGWDGGDWPFDHPLDYLGYDGGAGIGSGPGMLVGAALALRDSDRLAIGILGDGDYLMGVQALWTAAHERIPLLTIIANNRSYFNDEIHQETIASTRGRDTSRRWIGQRIDDPAPDLAAMARAQGLEGFGPVGTAEELEAVLTEAVALVAQGHAVVVDVLVVPGYSKAMAKGMTTD